MKIVGMTSYFQGLGWSFIIDVNSKVVIESYSYYKTEKQACTNIKRWAKRLGLTLTKIDTFKG